MVKFTDLLLELEFDSSKADKYEYKKDSSGLRYTFNTTKEGKPGIEYEVIFMPHDDSTFERMYRPSKKNPNTFYDMTGEGNAMKVNATVMDITLDFMKNNKDWYDIIISPINTKRLNIVKSFIEKSIPKNKYFVEENEGILSITRKLYAVPSKQSKRKKEKPYAA